MIHTRTKIVLVTTLMTFALAMFIVPKTQAYGSSFGTAETISTGNTYETFYSGEYYAYFEIYCSSGDILSITLYSTSYDLDLFLFNPSQSLVDSSTTGGIASEYITYTCSSTGYYYIMVEKYTSSTSYIDMDISKTSTPSIPVVSGFDLVVLLGIMFCITTILLTKLQRKRKLATIA